MSLFQDVTIDNYGDIITCKMHDLIHDLAQLVVGKEYAIVEGKKGNIGNRTRYLSSRTMLHFAETPSSSHKLRTFIMIGQQLYRSKNLDQIHFHFLLSLKCLRVLTLCGLDIVTMPKSVRELKHLRYLDLSRNHFLVNLPPDVSSLHNLQTLKLSECFKLKALPSNINKSLRHLEFNDCGELTCMPSGLGQSTNLQTLTYFLLDYKSRGGDISELAGLNSLRGKLEIKWLDYLREDAAVVESAKVLIEKKHLQELELRWRHDGQDIRGSPLRFQEPVRESIFLREYPIARGQLNEHEEDRGLKDEKILQGLQPHHSIKGLVIDGYCGKSLPDWIGKLSSLLSLEIRNCNGLESLPEGIRNLMSLQQLCIYNCSLLEIRCARINGKDWLKIGHIPKVLVSPFTPSALRNREHLTFGFRNHGIQFEIDEERKKSYKRER
ncbi:putative disease resistance RPP13-like protein 1, partial [Mucuna pruriens]